MAITRWNTCLVVTAPEYRSDPKLVAGLNQRITLDVRDMPIGDVVGLLRTMTAVNWVVDPPLLLEDAPKVTLQVREMGLDKVIAWVARVSSVTIAPIDGAWFVTRRPLPGRSITRIYDVSDLTMDIKDFPGKELSLAAAGNQGGASLFGNDAAKAESSRPSIDEIEELIRVQILNQK